MAGLAEPGLEGKPGLDGEPGFEGLIGRLFG